MKYLLILSLLTQSVFAQEDVKYLDKGTPAPYDGFLFSKDKERKIRLIDTDLQRSMELNKLYEEKILLQDKRIELRDKQMDDMSKRLSEKEDGFFTKSLYFILGAVLTTGIVFGVSKVSK